jgi:hypothetical protein
LLNQHTPNIKFGVCHVSVWMGFGVRKLLGLFALTGYFCTAEALLPHSRMIKARFIR